MGFMCGMRKAEILGLQVGAARPNGAHGQARGDRHERGHAEALYRLPKAVRDMLLALPGGGQSGPVFGFRGQPIGDIREGLKIACKGAKIAYGQKVKGGFTFHDLRRCFTTYARRAGVPKNVIEAIQGHSNGSRHERPLRH